MVFKFRTILKQNHYDDSIIYRRRANMLRSCYYNNHQKYQKLTSREDINSIHKNIINIPNFHDASKEFFNIRIENLFTM